MQDDISEDPNLPRLPEKVIPTLTPTNITKIEYKIVTCLPLLYHGTRLATMMLTNYKFNKIHHRRRTLLLILCQRLFLCAFEFEVASFCSFKISIPFHLIYCLLVGEGNEGSYG